MKTLLIILITCAILYLITQMILYPETISTISKNNLLNALNEGDEEAETYYKYHYIYRGKLLFEGPLTEKLIAEIYFNNDILSLKWYMKETGKTLKETLKTKKKESKM